MPPSKPSTITSSGTSELPSLLAYPEVLNLSNIPEIRGQYVYVIKDYNLDGLSVLIKRHDDAVYVTMGDWDGRQIDLSDGKNPLQAAAITFVQDYSSKFVAMMKSLRINQLLFYISVKDNDWQLVDLRASLNKFYGPGMVQDLFSKIFPTQEVVKIIQLDDPTVEAINRGEGSYAGNLILKCSKFKTIARGKNLLPLYARILR